MNNVKITIDDNCYYMTQDISQLGIYEHAKAIVDFCDKEIKNFEKIIDRAILDIFEKNGINVPNTNKRVLKLAFERLKAKGKKVVVSDIYHESNTYNAQVIKENDLFTIVLVENQYLECGVCIEEVQLHGRFEL